MNIKVLFFGITTDLTEEKEIILNVNDNLSFSELKDMLKSKYKKLEKLDSYAFAVNEEYVNYDIFLKPNDVIAVIPPVSGG